MQEAKYKIEPKEGTEEITILEGVAVVTQNPKEVDISNATLDAPHKFLSNKEGSYEAKNAHVLVNKESGSITLQLNEKDSNGLNDTIKGALKEHPIAGKLGLNTSERFTRTELIESIRRNRFYFFDKLKAGEIIKGLRDFAAKVEKRIDISDDMKGNTKNRLETVVSEIPFASKYDLLIPIYMGHDKIKLEVEICVDTSNNSIQFYLLSDDLFELLISYKEELIDKALKDLSSFKCSIVDVY